MTMPANFKPPKKPSILKNACNVTYEFKPEELERLIAADLGVDAARVQVEFVIENVGYDCRDGDGFKKVTKVRVSVRP